MFLWLALLLPLGLFGFLVLRFLSFGSQGDAHRIELFLSGEAVVDHYRPLERLLRNRDLQYLASQPGVSSAYVQRFRAQRRKLFREYLSDLVSDFGSICFLLKGLMIQSAADRPDLARQIRSARFSFFVALMKIEVSLFAQAVGFTSVSIDISELTRALESIATQVRALQLASVPSFA